MEILIKKVGNDGEGIGYYNKKPVFVYYAYKDEVVDITLKTNSRGHYEGEINKVIKKSPFRVKPRCPYYKKVGAANLMHINYEEQLNYKKELVKYHLNRNGLRNVKLLDTLPSEMIFNYRNKIDVPIMNINGKNKMGLYLRGTNRFFPIESYVLHKKELDEVVNIVLSLMDKYKINAYNYRVKKGFVSHLSLRSNEKREVQLAFVLKRDVNLKPLINELITKTNKVVSIYKTVNEKRTNNRNLFSGKLVHLYKDKFLKMKVSNKTFL